MIFALMLTCGWRRSRPRVYASRSGSADGTSVMLTEFVISSAVTAPRTGQLAFEATTGVASGTIAPGAPAAPVAPGWMPPAAAAAPGVLGQLRVRRWASIGATVAAFA